MMHNMTVLKRFGLYGGIVSILVSVLLPAGVAFAQAAPGARPPLDLMTSPLPLNVTTKPGVPVTADIRVKNNGTEPEFLKVDLMKFGANGDSGQPKLEEPQRQDLFMNWVHFSETTFTAQPNVWKTVEMTIDPPKEAAFGYYYAVLFTRANPDKPTSGQSAVEGGVASLVLLNVDAPGARREANVVKLTASQKVYEFLPASFSATLHNSGNIHLIPTGTLFIRRGDTQVAAMDFNNQQGNILPGTDRTFTMDWSDGFPVYQMKTVDGKTKRGSLNWDFSKVQKLRFGRYTATLVAVYDDGQRDVPIEATVSFWVIPWRILGVILLIVLIILAGIWGIGRVFWKGIRRRANAPVSDAPDPNSLAAAPRRSRGRPKKDSEAEVPVEQPKRGRPAKPSQGEPEALAEKPGRGRHPKTVVPEPQVVPEKPRRGRPAKVVQAATPVVEMPVEDAPKRRGRPPKSANAVTATEPIAEPVKRGRGRPPKGADVQTAVEAPRRGRPSKAAVAAPVEPPKRGRGRPRKQESQE